MDKQEFVQTIKAEAFNLGFTHVGIAPVLPVPHIDAYQEWLQAEYHASMTYLAREDALAKRQDPDLILEGCQSVICLAMPYNPPNQNLVDIHPGFGTLSSYAVTEDYHHIIWKKLSQLETVIYQNAGKNIHLKSYVDTGPILERSYASQAGIGIAGKNSCLIIHREGSYFFLAVILTDLDLPPDAPNTRDICGSCTRCIDACPTSCILPNHTINAGRCISYLTIEHRGSIPNHLKHLMGSWVFGCDVCQMVCPHNAIIHNNASELGKQQVSNPMDLIALFSLTEAEFTAQFGHTPLSRAKRQGLLRNAAIVLGNQRCLEALPTLKRALSDEKDPGVLDACQWAIEQMRQINPQSDHDDRP